MKLRMPLIKIAYPILFITLLLQAIWVEAGVIYPINKASILVGSSFDIKIEFDQEHKFEDLDIQLNNAPIKAQIKSQPVFISNESGKGSSLIYRDVQLTKPGQYSLIAKSGQESIQVSWDVYASGPRKVKNVIFFVGDGMTIANRTSARVLSKGIDEGKYQGKLSFDDMPNMALIGTSGSDSLITDSANSMSAYTTGHKTAVNAMGVYVSRATDNLSHPKVETISELKVDPKNSVSETPLHIASRNGSLSTAKVLISHESRALMTSQQYPVCATHLASERGYTDMLEILKQVTTLNCRGPNSQTPTFLAIKNRHTKTAEFIIKNLNFYSLGSKSSDTHTLKEIAAKNSDHESLKLLIDYSVPNKKLSDNQFSSLHYSAQNGDTKSTILLLESATPSQRKIDLERLSDGKTPLIVAIMNNRYEVTKILLDNSPFDVDKPFDYQSKQVVHRGMVTPLQASILNRNLRITKLLLSSGKFDVTKTVELTFFNSELGTSLKLSLIDLAIIVNSFEIFSLL
jgi:ankyrin repeat protein